MSGSNWQFGTNDSTTVKVWSEKVIRDAEKQQIFAPMMYSIDNPKVLRHPDAQKNLTGIIQVHSEFESIDRKGDQVTISNIGRINGRGVHGDALLRDTGAVASTYSLALKFEDIAQQFRSSGPMSERRFVGNFREEGKAALASWARRKVEEAIVLQLFGLTSWDSSGPQLDNWRNAGETSVFGNSIQAFDASHILYAGDATSDATIDSSDLLSVQLITKAGTMAMEDLDIPIEPLTINGEDCMVLFASNRGIEQLKYDDDYKNFLQFDKSSPLIKRAVAKIENIYVIPYPKCLRPTTNVGRAVLCGANALHMVKVPDSLGNIDWNWYEDFEDTRKRRKVISIGAALGIAPSYFNSARRNAIAIDHYVRT